ncbi:MAG TPA: glycine betaine ABC transporter substrate-binding protein [Ktedonobacteraceae bacterium]|jgi:osmoprotectant transport system substrate-binding protein|nr:glycine betaine ABC transporter substrate-binding protein [Ktedonobacteraceae bacterium]
MVFFRSLRAHLLTIMVVIPLLALAACGTSGNSPSSSGSSSSGSASKGPIIVASKLDTESQLIAKMYTLLLQKAGFTVNEKPALGNSTIIFQAIKSGAIDLYPEFTATGLNALNIPSSFDPQKDYQTVKQGFEQQYHITWLDMSPLNDGYALCTSQQESQKLGITTISQLAPKVSSLILTSPSDGIAFVDDLKSTYGFTTRSFKQTQTIDYALGFQAVSSGKSQITVCYTTDGTVKQKNFIFLQDDKNGFPQFHPAPIVRDAVLQKYPQIATTLNPLAPDLTTDVSIQLQDQVASKKAGGESVSQAITDVATSFLKSKGLL